MTVLMHEVCGDNGTPYKNHRASSTNLRPAPFGEGSRVALCVRTNTLPIASRPQYQPFSLVNHMLRERDVFLPPPPVKVAPRVGTSDAYGGRPELEDTVVHFYRCEGTRQCAFV